MQQMEVAEYADEWPRRVQNRSRNENPTERRLCQLLFLSFGVLCVVQAILNVTLRLTASSGCTSSQQCPAGWTKINSSCYFLSTEQKTWKGSRKYCQSKGADLVSINSEEEQRALYHLDGDADLLFWIGLKHTTGTNGWTWVDGSALIKPFWQFGQPDRGGPNNVEDCVEMYHHNPVEANWNDAPCGSPRRWLCERDTYSQCVCS